jgi:hypothetical protein
MYWNKELTYWITPKSGPIRSMETLLDANHALSQDLPWLFLKRPHWLLAGALLVLAAETGSAQDIQCATDGLLRAIELEGWMTRDPAAARERESPPTPGEEESDPDLLTVDFSLVPIEPPLGYGEVYSSSVVSEHECGTAAESIESPPASSQPLDALFAVLLGRNELGCYEARSSGLR